MNLGVTVSVPTQGLPPILNKLIKRTELIGGIRKEDAFNVVTLGGGTKRSRAVSPSLKKDQGRRLMLCTSE